MPDRVILIHGLWMRAFTLVALRNRLEVGGFAVELFDYGSVFHQPEVSVDRLLRRVAHGTNEKVHFVGHSLGGLIALQAARRAPDLIGGRIVCLGSPLRGSAVARGIGRLPGGVFLLGKSMLMLHDGLDGWQGPQPLGVIAGRLPFGFGMAVGALSSPHDGTVSVAETQLPGASDHCVVPATHTGLLFSTDAADETIAFLRTTRFTGRSY